MRDRTQAPNHLLDITEDVCPMTFVKAKLVFERAAPGDRLEILLTGDEPRRNVPAALKEAGAEILGFDETAPVARLHILKPDGLKPGG